jgi:glycerol-3-phosphate acyltransferase PlsY
MIPYLSVALVSYLLGSIPFGYLLVKLFKGEDVRISGSGNIGATNVARKSPALGIATLVLDAAKGVAAVLLAKFVFNGVQFPLLMSTAALFAVIGHLFPVWLEFRGGKGVATSLGAFILLTPKSIACMLVLFLILALAFRYVSLASVAVAAAFPLLAWIFHEYSNSDDQRQLVMIAVVSVLVIWKHRQNIRRIADGTESKLGSKKENRLETGQPSPANRDSDNFGASRQ